jgi:hypothetical protein
MSKFADTSNTALAYAVEATFDVAPTAGYSLLRNTSESFNTSIERADSDEITSSRQYSGSAQVSGSSSGSVGFQLSYGEYDPFLEAVLQSSGFSSAYSDTIVDISSKVCEVTSTANLKVGMLVKLTGLTVSTQDGVFTIGAISDATHFTVVETLSDEGSSTVAATHGGSAFNEKTDRSFTFEKNLPADGDDHFFIFSGQKASSLSLSMTTGSIISGDIGFMGATPAASATSKDGDGYTASLTNELMNSVSNVKGLSLHSIASNGTATLVTDTTFQELSVSIDNNLREQPGIGSLFSQGIGSGRIKVEASATLYFANREIYDEFLTNGTMQLRFQLTDSKDAYGNRYGFVLPQLKIASYEAAATGADSDIMATISFTGEEDVLSGTSSSIVITRIPSA